MWERSKILMRGNQEEDGLSILWVVMIWYFSFEYVHTRSVKFLGIVNSVRITPCINTLFFAMKISKSYFILPS